MSRNFVKLALTASVVTTVVLFNSANSADALKAPAVDKDYLNLLDSFKNYKQTSDLEKVSKVDSTFYTKDEKTMAELKKKSEETLALFLKSGDAKQSSATLIQIKSLNDAYNVLKMKLAIQKAASEAFDQASKEALKLDKEEKAQEKLCATDFKKALDKGDAVIKVCNDLENEDEKKSCSDELNACAAKINNDNEKFNEYLKNRNKLQASKPGYTDVSADADEINADISASAQTCNNFTVAMANLENKGNCQKKFVMDEKNESFLSSPPKAPATAINPELDSYMLIPKNRSVGWPIYKKMADDKIAETTAEMKTVKEYIEKLGGSILTGDAGTKTTAALPWTEKEIKDYLATNPSKEEIQKKIAGLSDAQMDALYHVAGLSNKDITKIDQAVAPGGTANGLWINDKHYSKKEIKDFYAAGGDDYKITKDAGMNDPWLARETMLKARQMAGDSFPTGEKALKYYFDQYASAHPDGVFAKDFEGWKKDQNPGALPQMQNGGFTGDPKDYSPKDYYERWMAGNDIAVPPYKPFELPDYLWINGEKVSKDQLKSFYANGGNDYDFAKNAGLSVEEAHQLLPVARLMGGLNPNDTEANLKYYYEQYTKANPTGVYAGNYEGWKGDQNPGTVAGMKIGTYTGDPHDKSPTDYCLEAAMCEDPRLSTASLSNSASISLSRNAIKPKAIQAAIGNIQSSNIKVLTTTPSAQKGLKSAVSEINRTLRDKNVNAQAKSSGLKKIYSDLKVKLEGAAK